MSESDHEILWIEKALNFLSIESQLRMSGVGSSDEKRFNQIRSMVMHIIHFKIKCMDDLVKTGSFR